MDKKDIEMLKLASKNKLFYILAGVLLLVFIAFRVDVLAVLAALMFIVGVVIESMTSASEKGIKNELKEIAIAIVAAVALWLGASFALNTDMPFNAVVSCSMLDTLQRGDVIVLYGGEVDAPKASLTKSQLEHALARGEEQFICGFCATSEGLRPCSINPMLGEEEFGDVIRYKCGVCRQKEGGAEIYAACTHGVYIGDTYIDAAKMEGDIIVYRPKPNDLFSLIGDIIHRAVAEIEVEGETYYLTKGDNNPGFDVQSYDRTTALRNSLVHSSQVIGKSIASVPFLGYVKLAASGQIANPENCNIRYEYME